MGINYFVDDTLKRFCFRIKNEAFITYIVKLCIGLRYLIYWILQRCIDISNLYESNLYNKLRFIF